MGKEAAPFSRTKAYATGDLTLYGGKLYEFTTNHSAGSWNANQVRAVDENIAGMATRVIAAYDNGMAAAAFAATVVFEPQSITGARYKYKLTT